MEYGKDAHLMIGYNERSEGTSQPHWKGRFKIHGKYYSIALWDAKKNANFKNGKVQELLMNEEETEKYENYVKEREKKRASYRKDAQPEKPTEPDPPATSDDDLPF